MLYKILLQLLSEMQRIIEMESFQSSVKGSWINSWSPQILAQSSIEKQKNKRLAKIIAEIPNDESKLHMYCTLLQLYIHVFIVSIIDCTYVVSLIYLVYMLPEARIKPNHELVIYSIPVSLN